jgi:hypothetical protein
VASSGILFADHPDPSSEINASTEYRSPAFTFNQWISETERCNHEADSSQVNSRHIAATELVTNTFARRRLHDDFVDFDVSMLISVIASSSSSHDSVQVLLQCVPFRAVAPYTSLKKRSVKIISTSRA